MRRTGFLLKEKWGKKSIPGYDSNLFFNFGASILQILKFAKNLCVSGFSFSTQQFSFYPPTLCVIEEKFSLHATYCHYEPRQFSRNNGYTAERIIRGSNPGRGNVFFCPSTLPDMGPTESYIQSVLRFFPGWKTIRPQYRPVISTRDSVRHLLF